MSIRKLGIPPAGCPASGAASEPVAAHRTCTHRTPVTPLSDDERTGCAPPSKVRRRQRRTWQTTNEVHSQLSERPLLSIRDAALRLNCSPRTIWRYIRAGELPVVRFGRATRIAEADLRAFIALHRS